MNEPLNFTDIPDKVSQFMDEAELRDFIQDSLRETGVLITSQDAMEVSEIAFDYITMKLSQTDWRDSE